MVFPLQLGYLHQEIGCVGRSFLFAFDLILVGSPVLVQLLDLAIGYFMSRLRQIKEQPQNPKTPLSIVKNLFNGENDGFVWRGTVTASLPKYLLATVRLM